MIKIEVKDKEIVISGHANYADYGKDIVCSSVSSIITTSINAILMFDKDSIYYEDNGKQMIIKIIKDNELTNKLILNMMNILKDLANNYQKNIKIIEMRDNK